MPESVPAISRVLGFDYGSHRIGVALGDRLTGGARPLAAIDNGKHPDWAALERCLAEWRPEALIVGLPLTEDGAEQPITTPAREFSRALARRTGLPVHLVDERYSSRGADAELRDARASGRMNRRVRKGDRDSQAARLIVEQWFVDGA